MLTIWRVFVCVCVCASASEVRDMSDAGCRVMRCVCGKRVGEVRIGDDGGDRVQSEGEGVQQSDNRARAIVLERDSGKLRAQPYSTNEGEYDGARGVRDRGGEEV